MFDIHFLPADHGDCIWIEYGTKEKPNRVLIDAGTQHSFEHLANKIKGIADDPLHFELFVVTHIDADHIGGSLDFLRDLDRLDKKIEFRDIWFNGWKHLVPEDLLGAMQGEYLTDHLEKRKLPWNEDFIGKTVFVPSKGDLPAVTLPGGLRLTLFSPSSQKLAKLRKEWKKTIEEKGLEPGDVEDGQKKQKDLLGGFPDVPALAETPFKKDDTAPNGSSIAFLAEFEGKSCFFTGDAHADLLIASIERLVVAGDPRIKNGRLQTGLVKIAHHGSKKNTSKELLQLLDSPKYLFSTSGQQFKHPDQEGVARVIVHGRPSSNERPKLYFNYRSKYNEIWDDKSLRRVHKYEAEYPADGKEGILVSL